MFNFDEGIIDTSSISSESGSYVDDDTLSVSERAAESGFAEPCPCQDAAASTDGQTNTDLNSDEAWILGAPKILKNDLRRSFARMFISAVNLGDFEKMQEFSHTFIRPNAPFSSRLMVSPEFCIPPVLHCVGPRSHVHYMLGCYVMFPDLVLNMGQSQIVTSNCWTGSKILIPFECVMTKTCNIPPECWVPAEDTAEKLYAEPSIDRMMAALKLDDASQESPPNASLQEQDILLKKLGLKSKIDPPGPKKRKRVRKKAVKEPPQYVPAAYADILRRDAVMMLCPQQMHFQGLYTLSLDETHHIQRIDLIVHPLGAATP